MTSTVKSESVSVLDRTSAAAASRRLHLSFGESLAGWLYDFVVLNRDFDRGADMLCDGCASYLTRKVPGLTFHVRASPALEAGTNAIPKRFKSMCAAFAACAPPLFRGLRYDSFGVYLASWGRCSESLFMRRDNADVKCIACRIFKALLCTFRQCALHTQACGEAEGKGDLTSFSLRFESQLSSRVHPSLQHIGCSYTGS